MHEVVCSCVLVVYVGVCWDVLVCVVVVVCV